MSASKNIELNTARIAFVDILVTGSLDRYTAARIAGEMDAESITSALETLDSRLKAAANDELAKAAKELLWEDNERQRLSALTVNQIARECREYDDFCAEVFVAKLNAAGYIITKIGGAQ